MSKTSEPSRATYIVGIVTIIFALVSSANSYANVTYTYNIKDCGIKLISPKRLLIKNASRVNSTNFQTFHCLRYFQVAADRPSDRWAKFAVMKGSIKAAVAKNEDLPWQLTETSGVYEFFQAGHPPQASRFTSDDREIITTSYGVMNCKYVKEVGTMAMCDSAAGLISNGKITLYIDLEDSEINISVSKLLMDAVFINQR